MEGVERRIPIDEALCFPWMKCCEYESLRLLSSLRFGVCDAHGYQSELQQRRNGGKVMEKLHWSCVWIWWMREDRTNSQSFRTQVTYSKLDWNNVTSRSLIAWTTASARVIILTFDGTFSYSGFIILSIFCTKEINDLNEIASLLWAHGSNGMNSKKG